jgi:hypothetical protein
MHTLSVGLGMGACAAASHALHSPEGNLLSVWYSLGFPMDNLGEVAMTIALFALPAMAGAAKLADAVFGPIGSQRTMRRVLASLIFALGANILATYAILALYFTCFVDLDGAGDAGAGGGGMAAAVWASSNAFEERVRNATASSFSSSSSSSSSFSSAVSSSSSSSSSSSVSFSSSYSSAGTAADSVVGGSGVEGEPWWKEGLRAWCGSSALCDVFTMFTTSFVTMFTMLAHAASSVVGGLARGALWLVEWLAAGMLTSLWALGALPYMAGELAETRAEKPENTCARLVTQPSKPPL